MADLSEEEELELLELENENAQAQASVAPAVPAAAAPGTQILGGKGFYSKNAPSMSEVLNTPSPELVAIQEGLKSAAGTAESYYSGLGVPKVGAAVGAGGRFMAEAIPARMKDALFVAMAGPALKIAGAVGRPIAKAGGNLLADVAGAVAGKSPEVIKTLFKKPGAIWKKANEVFTLKHQEAVVKSIDDGLAARGAKFKEMEEAFSGFSPNATIKAPQVDLKPVLDRAKKAMIEKGHSLPKEIAPGKALKVGRLPAESSEYKMLVEKLDFLKKTKELKFGDALNFRRQLDDAINYGVEGSNGLQPVSGEANRILRNMRQQINKQLELSLPTDVRPLWTKANADYSRAAGAYAELRKQVIGMTPRQTERKLLQMLQEGRYDDEVLSRVTKLGESSAKALDDVRDHLAAREMHRWLRGGIGAGTPLGLPTSPRLVGYGTSAAGAGLEAVLAGLRPAARQPSLMALLTNGMLGDSELQPTQP